MPDWKQIGKIALGAGRVLFPQIGAALEEVEKITGDPGTSNSEAVPALLKAAKRQVEVSADHEERLVAIEKALKLKK